MKISHVNLPDISGKPTQRALEILCQKLSDTMKLVIKLNNQVEDLKDEIASLKR